MVMRIISLMVDTTNAPPTVAEFLASLPAAIDCHAKYVPGKDLTARVRKELALAVTAGVFPAGTTFSVTIRPGGHTKSIAVDLLTWDGVVFSDAYYVACLESYADNREPDWRGMNASRYSPTFNAALAAMKAIADRHNFESLPANLVKYHAPDGIEHAERYTLEQILKWAERAKRGPIVHDKRLGWTVQAAA
jgi:hypothetical protein